MKRLRYKSILRKPLSVVSLNCLAVLLATLAAKSGFTIAEAGETTAPGRPRFASTLQLAIQEPNVLRMRRAQDLVIQEFEKNVQSEPQLKSARMSIQKSGNEVVISILTNNDLRLPMHQLVARLMGGWNQRAIAPIRGRTNFYRTSFTEPPEAEFTVTVHDPENGTVYINAEQAPLIDLLQGVRRKMSNFSYIIPQECALRRVYFKFGNPDPEKHPPGLKLKVAMQGIAEMLQVKMDHSHGAFVFSGDCRAPSPDSEARTREAEWGWPAEMLPMHWPVSPRAPEAAEPAVAVLTPRRPPPLLQSNLPVEVYLPVTPIDYEH